MPSPTYAKAPAVFKPLSEVSGRILVVDDEPEMLELVTLMLEAEGFEIVTAASGEAAIEASSNSAFDLAILDVAMEGIDGVDVAAQFRNGQTTSAMKIVFHTGVAESDIRLRFDGYDAYMRKPVEPLKLVHRVRKIFGCE